MDFDMIRSGMKFAYNGSSKKILRSLTPPIKGSKPQRVGMVDSVLRNGGVVCSFKVETQDDDGTIMIKDVGCVLNHLNLNFDIKEAPIKSNLVITESVPPRKSEDKNRLPNPVLRSIAA